MKPQQIEEPLYPLLSLVRHRIGTDGDGVTTLVAGAGCPLHCRWCINMEILKRAPAARITAGALLEKVMVDDLYYRATGGGITFGGGEPLLHASFIAAFRDLCPSDWRIRVETSLAVPSENVITAASAVDEFIVDCKDLDEDRYRSYTGGDVSGMLDNLTWLLEAVGQERILVRVPQIPGYNTEDDQRENARILQEMGFTRLDLFPYIIRHNNV